MGVSVPGQALSSEASKVAENAPVLRVLKKCPLTEPTCVVFDIDLLLNGERAPDVERHPNVISVTFDNTTGYGVAVVNVRGRLNGGPEKKYHIVFDPFVDGLRCQDFHGAAVGVSGKTGGTIFTDQGRLQIVDNNLSFGSRNSLQLIHKDTLARKNHLSPGWEQYTRKDKPIFKADGRVLWRVRSYCLDLESRETFSLLPEQECRGEKLIPVEQADIDKIRNAQIFKDSYVNERLKIDLWRLEGSSFFVYIWGVACT